MGQATRNRRLIITGAFAIIGAILALWALLPDQGRPVSAQPPQQTADEIATVAGVRVDIGGIAKGRQRNDASCRMIRDRFFSIRITTTSRP